MHHAKVHYLLSKDLSFLYVSEFLKEIFSSFVVIFIPIFLYKELGVSLEIVLFVYGLQYFCYGVLMFFSFKFLGRLGVKFYLVASVIFNVLRFYFLYLGQTESVWWLLGFVISMLIYEALYFPAIRVDEIRFSNRGERGRQWGFHKILMIFAGILAPLAGGYVVMKFGFESLFVVAAAGTFLSIVPLFFTLDEYPQEGEFTLKELINYYKRNNLKKTFYVFVADGFRSMNQDLLWPIFLFILIPDYVKVGSITSVVVLFSIVLTLWVGKMIDDTKSYKILSWGSGSHFTAWLAKAGLYFLTTISSLHVLIVSVFFKFSNILLDLPLKVVVLDRSERAVLKFSFIQKFSRQMGRSFLTWIVGIVVILFSVKTAIVFSFFLAGFLTLLTPWVIRKKIA